MSSDSTIKIPSVKIKKLVAHAILPEFSTNGAAGADLFAADHYFDQTYKFHEYGTGVAVEIPFGYVGLVFPRSSISKSALSLANSVGVIDSDYRGEIKLRFREFDGDLEFYDVGDRIGQLVIIPHYRYAFKEVEELGDTARGSGGFGSTGK